MNGWRLRAAGAEDLCAQAGWGTSGRPLNFPVRRQQCGLDG